MLSNKKESSIKAYPLKSLDCFLKTKPLTGNGFEGEVTSTAKTRKHMRGSVDGVKRASFVFPTKLRYDCHLK